MADQLILLRTPFVWVAKIDPGRDGSGAPIELMPQSRYAKADTTPLNPNGAGPFCRFNINGLPSRPGVYAVTVDEHLTYVGKSQNLEERWGPRGYAVIHPRNCFVGGQSTNCKINHRILLAAKNNQDAALWIHMTDLPGPLEAELIRRESPPWNGQVPWV